MPPLSAEQRRVLVATARVAGMAALVACASKSTAPTAPSAADNPRGEVPGTPQTDPSELDVAVTPAAAEPDAVLDLETCEATANEALQGVDFGARGVEASDEVVACCDLLLGEMEKGVPGEAAKIGDFDARWGCCAVVETPPGLACTPWGPPAPPAMV